MSKSLVIVESPAKAKTINKFLGPQYIVKPTGGHVVDLPVKEIGIDIEHGFTPKYSVIRGKQKIITDLKDAAGKVDTVLLATDPDREGEAIAWHVANRILGKDQPVYRILFNQITRNAVVEAIDHKSQLDMNKVNAQQARRVLDRLVGYQVSPFLWKTIYKGLSAGRVQSVSLRLIVERDTEIEAFTPEEYWHIDARVATVPGTEQTAAEEFTARLSKHAGKALTVGTEADATAIVDTLRNAAFSVGDVTSKKTKRHASPPFITSTLQQEAARRHGFTVQRTMSVAQELYEGIDLDGGTVGLITYMRTDSTRIAPEGIDEARRVIEDIWGRDYLPAKPNFYRTRKGAQDAHECIRPSSLDYTPEKVKPFLSRDQLKLYTTIWNRFVASQMNPAVLTVVTVSVVAEDFEFRASSSHVDFPGYLAVYKDIASEDDDENEDGTLPRGLMKGQALELHGLDPSQHFTKPPARYSEASLVREMESLGIGRPSTYAQTIKTLLQRTYVKREKGRLISTELGRNVNRILVQGFPDLFNVTFTASMEEQLDRIESGGDDWLEVVGEFYGPFKEALSQVNSQRKELKESLIEETGVTCEKCGRPMVIRWGRNGKFMACSGFPECRNTRPIEEEAPQKTGEICDKCGAPMEMKKGRFGRFLACSNYPECKNIKQVGLGVACPEEGCTGEIVEKRSRRGKIFYGCNRYPDCKFASWTKPVAATCPACGSPTLVESKNGEELTCPRCKSTFERDSIGTT